MFLLRLIGHGLDWLDRFDREQPVGFCLLIVVIAAFGCAATTCLAGCGDSPHTMHWETHMARCSEVEPGRWGFPCSSSSSGYCAGEAQWIDPGQPGADPYCYVRTCPQTPAAALEEEFCHCWCAWQGEPFANGDACPTECEG